MALLENSFWLVNYTLVALSGYGVIYFLHLSKIVAGTSFGFI